MERKIISLLFCDATSLVQEFSLSLFFDEKPSWFLGRRRGNRGMSFLSPAEEKEGKGKRKKMLSWIVPS